MAVSVDTVYKTVLLILNKEQRGYMTPDEFNKIGSQVQRQIFEGYFEDLNQQLRIPQSDVEYSDRVAITEEKIAEFKTEAAPTGTNPFTVPTDLYRLGSFTSEQTGRPIAEIQTVGRADYYNLIKSPLTAPSLTHPICLYENNQLIVSPSSITTNVKVQYVKKPLDIKWAFTTGSLGQLEYDSINSVDFELHNSERTEIILRVLLYQGIVIRDPQIVQVAAQKIQQEEVNEKS